MKKTIALLTACTLFVFTFFSVCAADSSDMRSGSVNAAYASSAGSVIYDSVIFVTADTFPTAQSAENGERSVDSSALGLSGKYANYEVESLYRAEMSADSGSDTHYNIYSVQIPDASQSDAIQVYLQLRQNDAIISCEYNRTVSADLVVPDDTYYSSQYAHDLCGTNEAWQYSTGSDTVAVAVLDSGISLSHADLADNIWTKPGEIAGNGTDDDGNGYIDDCHGWNFVSNNNNAADDYGHGTHVAGIIGAIGDNGAGVAGVN